MIQKIAISNDVINLLFVLGADIPVDLTDKGKAALETIITDASRGQRALSEGKSFTTLYTTQRQVAVVGSDDPQQELLCAPLKCVML